MRRRIRATGDLTCPLVAGVASGQEPRLVADIAPGPESGLFEVLSCGWRDLREHRPHAPQPIRTRTSKVT